MPLLGLPGKLPRREHVSGFDLLDAPAENIIAEGRIILAALSLITAWFGPDFLRPHNLLAAQVLIAYAVVAVAIVATRTWRLPGYGVGNAAHAIDIVVLCTLGFLTEGRPTPPSSHSSDSAFCLGRACVGTGTE